MMLAPKLTTCAIRLRKLSNRKKARVWEFNMFYHPPSKEQAASSCCSSRTIDELDGGAAERSMSWMVAQLYSDVASRPTRKSAVGGATPRGPTTTVGWRGFGPRDQEKRTRRAPLPAYIRSRRLHHAKFIIILLIILSTAVSQSACWARMLQCVLKIRNKCQEKVWLECTRRVS